MISVLITMSCAAFALGLLNFIFSAEKPSKATSSKSAAKAQAKPAGASH